MYSTALLHMCVCTYTQCAFCSLTCLVLQCWELWQHHSGTPSASNEGDDWKGQEPPLHRHVVTGQWAKFCSSWSRAIFQVSVQHSVIHVPFSQTSSIPPCNMLRAVVNTRPLLTWTIGHFGNIQLSSPPCLRMYVYVCVCRISLYTILVYVCMYVYVYLCTYMYVYVRMYMTIYYFNVC